jgi:hypothetical protein
MGPTGWSVTLHWFVKACQGLTLAYWAHEQVTKKMKCFEYDSRGLYCKAFKAIFLLLHNKLERLQLLFYTILVQYLLARLGANHYS